MKREHIWVLDFCVPVGWTVDLTQPGGDWDREFEPNTEEAVSFMLEGKYYEHMAFMMTLGQQIGKFATAAAIAIERAADVIFKIAEGLDSQAIKPLLSIQQELNEMELNKHGTHVVRSQNPKISLPVRKFNCGPPAPRLDRRRK